MPLTNDLINIGLSDKEAKVYLAALELGQASVQDISKKANVNRPTTYVILESLIKKGLCSTYQKDKKMHYNAESPEVIGSMLELQKTAIEEKQKQIDELMPQLRAVYNQQENKPVVRFFEGKDGLRTMIQEQMSSNAKMIRMMFSFDDVKKIFSQDEIDKAYSDRVAKKTRVKSMFSAEKYQMKNPSNLDESQSVPSDKFPISCDIAFFDDKIRIASLGKKLSGVIIEDEEIYKTFVSLFELAWLGAQTLNKKK